MQPKKNNIVRMMEFDKKKLETEGKVIKIRKELELLANGDHRHSIEVLLVLPLQSNNANN